MAHALHTVSSSHATVVRALTSRLGEVRDVASLWCGNGRSPLSETAYARALCHLRDECHEWTASDVLRALARARVTIAVDGGAETVDAPGGVPAYSWPTFARAPWAPLLCPVVATLLASCYEDWIEAALTTVTSMLAAAAPLVAAASTCTTEDLVLPQSAPDGEGGDSSAAAARHAAAVTAVEFARSAAPLVAALALAAQCPSAPTRALADSHGATLRESLQSIAHLVLASDLADDGGTDAADEYEDDFQ